MHPFYFHRLGLCAPASDYPTSRSGGAGASATKKAKTRKLKTRKLKTRRPSAEAEEEDDDPAAEEEEEEDPAVEEEEDEQDPAAEEEEEEQDPLAEEEEEEEGPAARSKVKKPAPKGGVIQRAISMFRGKGALGADIATLRAQVKKLTRDLATVRAERDGLKAQFGELEAALEKAEGERTTVQREVTHELASAGVPETKLPKKSARLDGAKGGLDGQIQALHAKVEATTDPREKGRLAKEIWDLEVKKAKGEGK